MSVCCVAIHILLVVASVEEVVNTCCYLNIVKLYEEYCYPNYYDLILTLRVVTTILIVALIVTYYWYQSLVSPNGNQQRKD